MIVRVGVYAIAFSIVYDAVSVVCSSWGQNPVSAVAKKMTLEILCIHRHDRDGVGDEDDHDVPIRL